ncbi:unnamed protein product [Caenorhabditis auriculariae]|uniref:long-chain-fatty-acid--CoA ligase n=1 Tax=Caenorhabditis auriculariae TaxID=2777116 RepID=A0A8S1GV65_9PELO|nr:unnamed protein product [Caenorhabditis auriculariae]
MEFFLACSHGPVQTKDFELYGLFSKRELEDPRASPKRSKILCSKNLWERNPPRNNAWLSIPASFVNCALRFNGGTCELLLPVRHQLRYVKVDSALLINREAKSAVLAQNAFAAFPYTSSLEIINIVFSGHDMLSVSSCFCHHRAKTAPATTMAVFKKLKKSKDKSAPLPEPEPVKQLDKRVGMDSYRDFFTLKNYWKAVDRKRQDSAQIFFSKAAGCSASPAKRQSHRSQAKPMGSGASKDVKKPPPPPEEEAPPQLDARLPYPNFRELFTLKNYWKTVRRNDKDCGKFMLAKYLHDFPENKPLYSKLKNVDAATVDASCSDPAFETMSANYLKVFDDVISAVEEKPGDVQQACDRLTSVGKMHRTKVSGMQATSFQNMEEPFVHMVKNILQDRMGKTLKLAKVENCSRILPGEERIHESILVEKPITSTPDGVVKTIYDAFLRSVETNSDGALYGEIVDGNFEWTTYAESLQEARAIGSGLVALGVKPGSLVGIAGIQSRRYMHAMHGLMSYSMPIVPLYHNSKLQILCEIIENCKLNAVFCDNQKRANDFLEAKVNGSLASLDTIILLNDSEVINDDGSGVKVMTYQELKELGTEKRRETVPPSPESIYVICHTSGTTGRPKGVEMSHSALLAAVAGILTSWLTPPNNWTFGKDDVYFSFLSLAHIYEHLMQTFTIYVGGSIGVYSGDVSKLIAEIQLLQPTILSLVPRLLNKLYEAIHSGIQKKNILAKIVFRFAENRKLKYLRKNEVRFDTIYDKIVFKKISQMIGGRVKVLTSGGAPLTAEVKDFTRIAYGCPFVEGYGQTECSAAGTLTLPSDTSNGNVGGPSPWAQIKLIDAPEQNYFSEKDEGEICFRGAALMTQYYQDEELTHKAIDSEGWLHTGDIGRWLPNGTLQIVDRKNALFKLAQGDFVSPEQIEAVYTNSPLITQLYVTGSAERSFLVGVAVVNVDTLQAFLQKKPQLKNPSQMDEEELLQSKEVRNAVLNELNATGKASGLQTIELIRNLVLITEEFTAENGLVTPTLKHRRHLLKQKFAAEIEEMYKEIAEL